MFSHQKSFLDLLFVPRVIRSNAICINVFCLIRKSALVQFKSTTLFRISSFAIPNLCVCERDRWSQQNVIKRSRNDRHNFIPRILSLMILWSISEHRKMSSNVNILFPSLPIQMICVFNELTFPSRFTFYYWLTCCLAALKVIL